MNWNSLRANAGDKIIDGLSFAYSLREIHLNNNLLGVSYDDKQPPVNRFAELL